MQNSPLMYKKPLFNTLPLYLLVLLLTLPFLLRIRVQPITSYVLDNVSFILALSIVLICGIQGRIWHKVPKGTWYFLSLAVLWYLQSLYIDLPFVGQSYFAIGVFLGLAALAFAMRGLLLAFGREKIVLFIASGLLIGSILQFGVGLIQLLDLELYFNGLVLGSKVTTIYGQLGQRNHFGHYLMWGLVSTCYLYTIGKLRLFLSGLIIVMLTIGLALTGSRTVVLYAIIVMIITVLWSLRMRNFASKRLLKISIFAVVILILMQWIVPGVLSQFGLFLDSGMGRLASSSSGARRWFEWHKAWLIFKEYPFFGVGWSRYASAAYALDTLPAFINEPKESGLFTHSHNILTELLSEMGLLGTLLVVVGFSWVIWRYITEKASLESWILLCLMGVSLSHSLLEYPLWYVYFLAPFVVFMSLGTPTEKEISARKCWFSGGVILLLATCLFGYCIHLITVYDELQNTYFLRNVEHGRENRIKKLELLAKNEPLFRFYTLYTLESIYYPSKSESRRAKEVNKLVTDYRPYSYPLLRKAMYQDLAGEKKEALQTIIQMNTYYLVLTPEFLEMLGSEGDYRGLISETLKACQKLKEKKPKTKCTIPKKIISSDSEIETK